MSTHVPSFAISKKGSGSSDPRARLRNLVATSWVGVWVVLCGCVTDTIEFEESFNQPLKVVDYTNSDGSIIPKCTNDSLEVKVSVWDPDVDQEDVAIDAKLYLSGSKFENREGQCGDPNPTGEYLGQVPIYEIECEIDLSPLRIWATELLRARVLISDLGFNQNQPWNNAHTAQVNWTVQVKEITDCDDSAQ